MVKGFLPNVAVERSHLAYSGIARNLYCVKKAWVNL